MNKAIFFDVDNTLVSREENTICESTIRAIEKLKNNNVNVAIATGRSLAMVKQEEFHKMFKTIISAMKTITYDEVNLPSHKEAYAELKKEQILSDGTNTIVYEYAMYKNIERGNLTCITELKILLFVIIL